MPKLTADQKAHLARIEDEAIAQILRHLPNTDWTFAWDRATRSLGACRYGPRTITLSKPCALVNTFEVARETILHEIAHALTPGSGHGAAWKAACRQIGARPERCATTDEITPPPAPWALECPHCGRRSPRYRRTTKRYACRPCGIRMRNLRQPVHAMRLIALRD